MVEAFLALLVLGAQAENSRSTMKSYGIKVHETFMFAPLKIFGGSDSHGKHKKLDSSNVFVNLSNSPRCTNPLEFIVQNLAVLKILLTGLCWLPDMFIIATSFEIWPTGGCCCPTGPLGEPELTMDI